MNSDEEKEERTLPKRISNSEKFGRELAELITSPVSSFPEIESVNFSLEWIQQVIKWEPKIMKSITFEIVHLKDFLGKYPDDISKKIHNEVEHLQNILERYNYKNAKDDLLQYKFVWFFRKSNRKDDLRLRSSNSQVENHADANSSDSEDAMLAHLSTKATDRWYEDANSDNEDSINNNNNNNNNDPTSDNNLTSPSSIPDTSDITLTDNNKTTDHTMEQNRDADKNNNQHEEENLATLEDFLNQYSHGIIMEYKKKSAHTSNDIIRELSDNEMSGKPVKIGILRGYCDHPHEWCLDWDGIISYDPSTLTHKKKCMHCGKGYEKISAPLPWLTGISKEHKDLLQHLCGLCIVGAHLEMLDPTLLGISDYFEATYQNARKVKALCLVHRLFTSTPRLLLTVSDQIIQAQRDPARSATIPQMINFVKLWLQLLWYEDFPVDGVARKTLNHIISNLLELSRDNDSPKSMFAATQMLLTVYRDQYLQEKTLRQTETTISSLTMPILMSPTVESTKTTGRNTEILSQVISRCQQEAKDNRGRTLFEICALQEGNEDEEIEEEFFVDRQTSKSTTDTDKTRSTLSNIQTPEPRKKTIGESLFSFLSSDTNTSNQSSKIIQECQCIAEQLTLMMFEKLRAVRPPEFLRKNWTGEDGHKNAPNIIALREMGETIAIWVKLMIIAPDISRRKEMMERVVHIAMFMKTLQNQYGHLQIFATLESPSIKKFSHIWTEIEKQIPTFAAFKNESQELLKQSGGFRNLVAALNKMEPPAIPCLWLTLKHAFLLDEVLRKSKIGRADPNQTGKLWDIYEKFDQFRIAPYPIKPEPEVQRYLQSQLVQAQVILHHNLINELDSYVKTVYSQDIAVKTEKKGLLSPS